jgi:hypothetical protein
MPQKNSVFMKIENLIQIAQKLDFPNFYMELHAKNLFFLCKGLKRIPNIGVLMKGTHGSFTDNNMREPGWAALTIWRPEVGRH